MFGQKKVTYPIRDIKDMEWDITLDASGNKKTHPYSEMMANSKEGKRLLKMLLPKAKAELKQRKKAGELSPTMIYRDAAAELTSTLSKPMGIALFLEDGVFTAEIHMKSGQVLSGISTKEDAGNTDNLKMVSSILEQTIMVSYAPIWNLGENMMKWPDEIGKILADQFVEFSSMLDSHEGESNKDILDHYLKESFKVPMTKLKDLDIDLSMFASRYIGAFFDLLNSDGDDDTLQQLSQARIDTFAKERKEELEEA